MTTSTNDPRQPCEIIRLGEFEDYIKLDGGEIDTTIRPVRLSKKAREYMELAKGSEDAAPRRLR